MIAVHERDGLADAVVGAELDRVRDDPVLGALDSVNLFGLPLDAHVAVDDADAAFSGDGHCEAGFCDRVHRCAADGAGEADAFEELSAGVDFAGQDGGLFRDEEYVVETEPFAEVHGPF